MKVNVPLTINSPADYLLAARAAMGCETWQAFYEASKLPRVLVDAIKRSTHLSRSEAVMLAKVSGVPVPQHLIEPPACHYRNSSDPYLAAKAEGCFCDECVSRILASPNQ